MHGSGGRESTDRGVSEMLAVGTLVGLALLLVLGIGINVFLFAPGDSGPPEGNFTYQHIDQASALVVTYERGDTLRAGDVHVEGDDGNATWAELAGSNVSSEVVPGDAVQIGEQGAFGEPIRSSSRISLVWRNSTMNETSTLSRWNGDTGL